MREADLEWMERVMPSDWLAQAKLKTESAASAIAALIHLTRKR